MSIRKKTLNILSTAFLVLSLIVAGGLAADTLNPHNAEANAKVQDDLEIDTMSPYCVGPPVDCYEPVVITPESE